jgi:hypothetical protein
MNLLLAAQGPGLTSWDVFLHLPIMFIIFNFIFSATRYDDWRHTLQHAVRGAIYSITFLGGVFVVLIAFDFLVPKLFG